MQIEKRIANYKNNLNCARNVNLNAVIYINHAINTLKENHDNLFGEIKKISDKLKRVRPEKRPIGLVARWTELVWLQNLR